MPHRRFKSSQPKPAISTLPELGMDQQHLLNDFKRYYNYRLGRDENCGSLHYAYEALSLAISDRLTERWKKTYNAYKETDCKRACYLSMEFLIGRRLSNAMLNLGINNAVESAMYELGLELEELIDTEPDAGLGNGGLGRLAVCLLDSCATLQLPVTGYGLRYEYGMFSQVIINGEQVEEPDHWLRNGNIWEIERLEYKQVIKFGGRTKSHIDENGKELRLRQQYLLASASLQDVIARWIGRHGSDFSDFAAKHCFQLNDTHPTIAVAELMRLLVDIHGLSWDEAWSITRNTMAYTNHTLLPEALERWSVNLFKQLLPRLMEIIFEINARFLAEVSAHWPGDKDRLARMSLIEEGDGKQHVRMAYLAIVGSYSVNGVAKLHSKLLQQGLFHDFYELWPGKFNNKTNGVTPRRWLAMCNMKFMMNGALTIGTLDGANIEIREEVGDDNFFLFGLTEEQVEEMRHHYDPVARINQDEDLQRVIKLIECGHFSQFEPGIFDDILASIKSPHDPWMTIADFRSFVDAQKCVEAAFQDKERWTRMSIINCANSGKFSTDRTISEYNNELWKLTPVNIGKD